LVDGFAALALGNSKILARYLRESSNQPHYTLLTKLLADVLDRSSAVLLGRSSTFNQSSASALADLWSSGFEVDQQLVFVRRRRGKPKSRGLNIFWIGQNIEAALGDPPKVEPAIAEFVQQTGLSRATAFRAWKSYRSKKQAYEKACKKDWEGRAEPTQQECKLVKSIGEQLKSLQTRQVSPKSD
jgi:hypothetical protein